MSKPQSKPKKGREAEHARREIVREDEIIGRALREAQQSAYITPYLLATKLEIKIGVARRLLRELESQGKIRLVSRSRRSPLYVPA